MAKRKKKITELVFGPRVMDPTVGAFALRDRYQLVHDIHRALDTAKTWGEFRTLLPAGEFEALNVWVINGGEHLYFDGERYHFNDPDYPRDPAVTDTDDEAYIDPGFIVKSSDRFDAWDSGVIDGDMSYPPFLEPEQDQFLPYEFCARYGKKEISFTSGSWWEFPLDSFQSMKEDLEQRGFLVTWVGEIR